MITDRLPKVTFVTRKWPPSIGGMETYSLKLVDGLRRYCQVELMALAGNRDGSTPSAARLFTFGLKSSFRLLFYRQPGEVLHIGDMASWPLAAIGLIRSRCWSLVLSAHGTDVTYSRRSGLKGRIYGWYLALGALLVGRATVIANSNATAAMVGSHGFKSVVVVRLATDMLPPEPLPEHGDYILFVGRLIPGKGCGWFIQNVLPKISVTINLKVAGTVWDEQESELLRSPRVEFLGPIVGSALQKLYAEAKCVVVPNIEPQNGSFEGFGIVATEAAAAGAVVLAANHAGLKDAVIDGVTGFQIAVGEPDEWAAKIAEISRWTSAKRQAFLETSMRTVRREYSWDRVTKETLAIYDIDVSSNTMAG